ncbi:phage minor tail protein L, partial [Escherichia coli]|uniref:phage minor tail protein L n=1 Tax=Escherichia coli TaxID=562 RepID=UPI001CC4B99B
SPLSRTTPQAHTAGHAPESLILSVSLDLLRKFVNGKETAKISHHAAHLTPAHALAASVLTVSNLFGLVTGMAEDLQSLVGATVVRRRVYARFLDAVNFVAGNPEADPEQELSDRWVVEQMSQLTAMTASFVLATPTETDGALFPGRIMLANTCMWDYRGDECGYNGPAVADEFDNPTTDIRKDRCSKCMRGCEMRGMVANFGGFLSINKLSQ